MNILFTGGKTQGHIQPILALIEKYVGKHKLFYIGVKGGIEEKLMNDKKEVKSFFLKSYGLSKNPFKLFLSILFFLINYFKSKKIIKENKINLIIGTGGFITVSVINAAFKMKIKTVIHEQNVLSGKANNYLAKKVDLILTSFKKGCNHFPEEKTIYTGNPAASIILNNNAILKTKEKYPIGYLKLLIISGSNGSRKINDITKETLEMFKENKIYVTWITGERYYLEYKKYESEIVKIYPYTHLMIPLMAESDIIISRAGATTISEIICLNKPAILIPSKNVSNNHQEYNCDYLYDIHAALKIKEDDLNPYNLIKMINKARICSNNIKDNLSLINPIDPAKKIVELIEKMVG